MKTFPVLRPLPSATEEQLAALPPTVGILSTYPPTACGLATFTEALCIGLLAQHSEVNVVRIADGTPATSDRIIGEMVVGSHASVRSTIRLLNQFEIAVIQHEYGIYGGRDGADIVGVLEGLDVPSIVVAHTVLTDPTPRQRMILERIAALTDGVIVMSDVARHRRA